MKDNTDDSIEVEPYADALGAISLRVQDTGGPRVETAVALLSAKKARKLARKLIAAADEIDDAQGRDLGPTLEERLTNLERENRAAARVSIAEGARLEALQAEQRWDREQITVLLADFGSRLSDAEETEPVNAKPLGDEVHYLLPASWIVDKVRHLNTSKPGWATFEVPPGTSLEDRVSTGFDS